MCGHRAGISRRPRLYEAVGKPESWGVCESALKPRGVWEGSWRIGQGSKPDLVKFGRPGLSGGLGKRGLCRRARALSQQPTHESWELEPRAADVTRRRQNLA